VAELARYLFQSGDYSKENKAVRTGAFLPRHGATSVFWIDQLDDLAIRAIGDEVGTGRGVRPKGRGELDRTDVTAVGLRFERDDTPFRHGNILGWPVGGPEVKAQQKAIALDLAGRAVLILH
jgi:hypothetical protein